MNILIDKYVVDEGDGGEYVDKTIEREVSEFTFKELIALQYMQMRRLNGKIGRLEVLLQAIEYCVDQNGVATRHSG